VKYTLNLSVRFSRTSHLYNHCSFFRDRSSTDTDPDSLSWSGVSLCLRDTPGFSFILSLILFYLYTYTITLYRGESSYTTKLTATISVITKEKHAKLRKQ